MLQNQQPHQRQQLQQLQQNSVMISHQNGPQISSGLGRQNPSMSSGTRYASVQQGVTSANQLVPTDQSQLVYILPQGPPKQYQTPQSATDPQQNMFVQVRDPQMFGSQFRSRSPGPVFDSQHQERLQGQLLHEQRQHEQRLFEQHRLGTAILPIPEMQGNKELPKEPGTLQRHRQQASAAIVDGTTLEVMAITSGPLSTSASSENQRNTESRIRATIVPLSSATVNVLEKQQHVNNSLTVERHTDIQADTYEFGKEDEPKANTSSSTILWSSTPAQFVSASSSGEQELSPNNLPVTAADHSEQDAASSDNTESTSKYLAHSSKPDVFSASPAKPSAKRARKPTTAPVTKSAKKPATKPARKPTQRSQARLSDVAKSTSSTADNEDPAMEVQQLCNELVGQSHVTVSPDDSGRIQSQMPITQESPFSSTLLSAYITSKSAMDTDSLASHYPAPEDHLVWARKLAHQAIDSKKQFDSLTERLSNDEGKWGELMQKHTASVRKAVSELKKDVRDRATQCNDLIYDLKDTWNDSN
ncbi:hypothetical protein V1515DRAFT_185998 [Lipomyces mesembrius]